MQKLLRIQVARAIAANLVVLVHSFKIQNKYVPDGWLPDFLQYGFSGVDIFFVLSGFIIVVAGSAMQPAEFLWRRAGRIYPTYWLISVVWLTLIVCLPSAINTQLPPSDSLWRSFLLIPDNQGPPVAVAWTLTYEVYFYVVFALILALRLRIAVGLLAWAVALVALRVFAGGAVASSPVASAYTAPLVAEFMMGALVGLAYQRGISAGANVACGIGIAALAVSIILVAPAINLEEHPDGNLLRTLLFGVPAAFTVYWLGARELQGAAKLPRWLVLIGDASYSTYLTHYFVLAILSRAFHAAGASGVWGSLLLTVLGVIAANLTGVLLFQTFERPTLRVLRRFGIGGESPPPKTSVMLPTLRNLTGESHTRILLVGRALLFGRLTRSEDPAAGIPKNVQDRDRGPGAEAETRRSAEAQNEAHAEPRPQGEDRTPPALGTGGSARVGELRVEAEAVNAARTCSRTESGVR